MFLIIWCFYTSDRRICLWHDSNLFVCFVIWLFVCFIIDLLCASLFDLLCASLFNLLCAFIISCGSYIMYDCLTLNMLLASSADNRLMTFYLFFLENKFEISSKLSHLETIWKKYQILISRKKKKKNIFKMSSAEFFTQHANCWTKWHAKCWTEWMHL